MNEVFSPSLTISKLVLDSYPELRKIAIHTVDWGGQWFRPIKFILPCEVPINSAINIRIYEDLNNIKSTDNKILSNPPTLSLIISDTTKNINFITLGNQTLIEVNKILLPTAIQLVSEVSFRMGKWFYEKYKSFSIEDIKDNVPINNSVRSESLRDAMKKNLTTSFAVNFSDGERKPSSFYFKDEITRPIFSFARHIEHAGDYILMPLSTHQSYGTKNFKKISVPKQRNSEKIFWRGSTTGTIHNNEGKTLHFNTVINKDLLLDPTLLRIIYSAFHRFQFVYWGHGKYFMDVGFINSINGFKYLTKSSTTQEEALKFIFQMAIEGNDFASSLPWQLLSGAIVFLPKPRWHSIFNYGLKNFHNCLICERDFVDLESLFLSIKNNDALKYDITSQAVNYSENFCSDSYSDLIFRLIMKIYDGAYY
jgi:hypothetical protein